MRCCACGQDGAGVGMGWRACPKEGTNTKILQHTYLQHPGTMQPHSSGTGKAALSDSGCLCGFSPFYPHFLFCLSTSRAQMYTLFMLPQKLFYKHVLYQTSTFLGSQPACCELSQEIQWAKDLISFFPGNSSNFCCSM